MNDNSNPVNPNANLEKVVDLVEIAGGLPSSTVVVVGGHRIEDLRLVESARDHGIVDRIILVGSKERITKSIAEVGIEIDPDDIVPADSDQEIARKNGRINKGGRRRHRFKGRYFNAHHQPPHAAPGMSIYCQPGHLVRCSEHRQGKADHNDRCRGDHCLQLRSHA